MKAMLVLFFLIMICDAKASEILIPIDPEMQKIKDCMGALYDDPAPEDELDIAGKLCAIQGSADSPYLYYWMDPKSFGWKVKAVNKTGGRSYICDLMWNVSYYIFSSAEECDQIGRWIIQWCGQDLSDARKQQVLLSLGWRGLYTGAKRGILPDICGTVGCFMMNKENRVALWNMLYDDSSYINSHEKSKCIESMISVYDSYNTETKSCILNNIECYLKINQVQGIGDGTFFSIGEWLKTVKKGLPSVKYRIDFTVFP